MRNATRRAQRFVSGNDFQTKRTAPSETDELRNGRKAGGARPWGKIFIGRNKTDNSDASGDFNPSHRQNDRNSARRGFNFPMRDGNDGAIVIVFGNCSAVQPRVQRRADFRRRHEQPQRERQNPRREKNSFARAAVELEFSGAHSVSIKATVVPKPASQFARLSSLQIAPLRELAPAHCRPRNV